MYGVGTSQSAPRISIITSSRRGRVHTATRDVSSWSSVGLNIAQLEDHEAHQVVPLSPLSFFLVAGTSQVHLVDLEDHRIVFTFHTERMQQSTLQSTFSKSQSSQASQQGLRSFTLCYTAAESGDCVLQTYIPAEADDLICPGSSETSTGSGWCSWGTTKETKTHIQNPGTWSVLADSSIIGVRQKPRQSTNTKFDTRRPANGLRHRSPRKENGHDLFERWEVWSVSQGHRPRPDETRPLFQGDEKTGHLFVSGLGPMVRVGQRSIALGFGNVVKLVSVGGPERFEASWEERQRDHLANVGSRRRKANGMSRPGAWS